MPGCRDDLDAYVLVRVIPFPLSRLNRGRCARVLIFRTAVRTINDGPLTIEWEIDYCRWEFEMVKKRPYPLCLL